MTAELRAVTVFDVGLAPGLAFIRSLGKVGVPVIACSERRVAAGRFSRFVTSFRAAPDVADSEVFVSWLVEEISAGRIDLVAPTSDHVVFCVAEAIDRLRRPAIDVGLPATDGIRTCLFKGRFADALAALHFPCPPAAIPDSLPEALQLADTIGYPVLLKPRSHVGVGAHRGVVARSRDELGRAYQPYPVGAAHGAALRHVPGLSKPMLQKYFEPGTADVISLSGCLGLGGELLALQSTRKVAQSPPRFGVGMLFEPVPEPAFTQDAVRVVRSLLGSGLFELEVLVDQTGRHYAIDLNPRGFGQMTLDIALGNDLPRIWYGSVTGSPLPPSPPRHPPPALWQDAVPMYLDLLMQVARGPERRAALRRTLRHARAPKVGSTFDLHDPIPGVLFGLSHVHHPRALLRRLTTDVETADHYYGDQLSTVGAQTET